MSHPLILPMLIQMVLSSLILLTLAPRRIAAVKKAGGVKGLIKAGGFKKPVVSHGDNFKNQFETPVMFYALCLLFIATGAVSGVATIAAWVFVTARIIHAAIHLTYNRIFPDRFVVFLIGSVALIVMIVAALMQALS